MVRLCSDPHRITWLTDQGGVVFYRIFGTKLLFVNSMQAVKDLLETRFGIYSDRPQVVYLGELVGLKQAFNQMNYGEDYKRCRNLTHVAFSPSAVKQYEHTQQELSVLLASTLHRKPEDFVNQVRLYGVSTCVSAEH